MTIPPADLQKLIHAQKSTCYFRLLGMTQTNREYATCRLKFIAAVAAPTTVLVLVGMQATWKQSGNCLVAMIRVCFETSASYSTAAVRRNT